MDMKNEKLFEAIGDLDEHMIAQTEIVPTQRSKRIGWRVMLVAAIVAGLGVTAVAAPILRNAVKGGKLETKPQTVYTPTDPVTGQSQELHSYEITLEVEFDQDAPKSIETYYIVPDIPEEFNRQFLGHIMKDEVMTQFGWVESGTDRDICFNQWAGRYDAMKDVLTVNVTTASGAVPKHGLRTFGGIQGYLVEEPTLGENYGEREFYWSDGAYLFRLQVPCDYTDAQLEAMVASVRPVEDITPYLSTMTEQEIADIFGKT